MLMGEWQWKRLDVVTRLEKKQLPVVQAARVLGLTERQVRNLRAELRKRGRRAVIHGNAGRRPPNRLRHKTRTRILSLRRGKYRGDINDAHFTEKLVEDEKISVSLSTVRRVLRAAGIPAVRRRRPPRHHRRRDRKPREGMMVLWDGSRHDWLEGRGPMLCLMGAVEDATGELLPGAHFVDQECSAGYLRVLKAMAEKKGLPWSAYMDRHSSLKRNDDHWTLVEELQGKQEDTQVGRALAALGIEPIFALSPQAKGRVERRWGYLQDRLVTELRLARARTLAQANAVLARVRGELNAPVVKSPRDPAPAWRPLPPGLDLGRVCSFFYEATVQNDNTVRLGGHIIDIPPGPGRRSYARARVEVRQLLDGSFRVYHRDVLIATAPAPAGPLRALKRRKRSTRLSRAYVETVQSLAQTLS
jgi:transposase